MKKIDYITYKIDIMNRTYFSLASLAVIAVGFLFNCSTPTPSLPPTGMWRAELTVANGDKVLPFLFEIKDEEGKRGMVVHNADERLSFPRMIAGGDSVHIPSPVFNTELVVKVISDDRLEGYFYKLGSTSPNRRTPFKAMRGDYPRFETTSAPSVDVSGEWETSFHRQDKDIAAVGEFRMEENKMIGTFRTAAGDYRYLEGVVEGNQFQLSTFDGSHVYLFQGMVEGDNIRGRFYSGYTSSMDFDAVRGIKTALPEPESRNSIKEGYDNQVSFTFDGLDQDKIIFPSDAYKNKVVILQILGSWCPNCMDETPFLADLHRTYRDKGLEVIGLAYEYGAKDLEHARELLKKSTSHLGAEYQFAIPVVGRGTDANSTLPMLEGGIKAYPTTIFVDRKGVVRKIHTGFNGPSTSLYEAHVKETHEYVQTLLDESAE